MAYTTESYYKGAAEGSSMPCEATPSMTLIAAMQHLESVQKMAEETASRLSSFANRFGYAEPVDVCAKEPSGNIDSTVGSLTFRAQALERTMRHLARSMERIEQAHG